MWNWKNVPAHPRKGLHTSALLFFCEVVASHKSDVPIVATKKMPRNTDNFWFIHMVTNTLSQKILNSVFIKLHDV